MRACCLRFDKFALLYIACTANISLSGVEQFFSPVMFLKLHFSKYTHIFDQGNDFNRSTVPVRKNTQCKNISGHGFRTDRFSAQQQQLKKKKKRRAIYSKFRQTSFFVFCIPCEFTDKKTRDWNMVILLYDNNEFQEKSA